MELIILITIIGFTFYKIAELVIKNTTSNVFAYSKSPKMLPSSFNEDSNFLIELAERGIKVEHKDGVVTITTSENVKIVMPITVWDETEIIIGNEKNEE